jgi:hypothetical protein
MPIDPLDTHDSLEQAWEVFRSRSASVSLLDWLFRDLEQLAPGHAKELWHRIGDAAAYKQNFEEDGTYDGLVPFHSHDGEQIDFWIEYEQLDELGQALFPHGIKEKAERDLGRYTVIVSMHSALESYCRDVSIETSGSLPGKIQMALAKKGGLDAELLESFRVFDATRHIIVHSGGIVDDHYIRAVHNSPFVIGEERVVNDDEVDQFLATARKIAALVRALSD